MTGLSRRLTAGNAPPETTGRVGFWARQGPRWPRKDQGLQRRSASHAPPRHASHQAGPTRAGAARGVRKTARALGLAHLAQ
eukprot:12867676-Alexandrium_andersonii.AAC.1